MFVFVPNKTRATLRSHPKPLPVVWQQEVNLVTITVSQWLLLASPPENAGCLVDKFLEVSGVWLRTTPSMQNHPSR